jgi:hypothetical protein
MVQVLDASGLEVVRLDRNGGARTRFIVGR